MTPSRLGISETRHDNEPHFVFRKTRVDAGGFMTKDRVRKTGFERQGTKDRVRAAISRSRKRRRPETHGKGDAVNLVTISIRSLETGAARLSRPPLGHSILRSFPTAAGSAIGQRMHLLGLEGRGFKSRRTGFESRRTVVLFSYFPVVQLPCRSSPTVCALEQHPGAAGKNFKARRCNFKACKRFQFGSTALFGNHGFKSSSGRLILYTKNFSSAG